MLKLKELIPIGILIFAFIFVGHYLYPEFMSDDAFIHIGFANDIAKGIGYSFTGNFAYGSTSPLWSPMIAMLSYFGIDSILSARLLSSVFSIFAIYLLYKILINKIGTNLALILSAIFAFNAYFLRWSQTGMESTAACVFMLLIYICFKKEIDNKTDYADYFIIGLAPLIRPEFYLFLLIYGLSIIVIKKKEFDYKKIIPLIIPALAWNIFAYYNFASIIPTTFMAKASYAFLTVEIENVIRTAKLFFSSSLIEIIALICLSAVFYFNRKKIDLPKILIFENIFLFSLIFFFYGFYILKNVTILSRYALILLPIYFIILGNFIPILKVIIAKNNKYLAPLTLLFISFSLIFNFAFTTFIVKPDADKFTDGFQKEYKKIAKIIQETGSSKTSIALSDVGIVGALSRAKVYDFCGLVDKDRFKFKSNHDYFLAKRPAFLLTRGELDLNTFKDESYRLYKITEATIPNLGINLTKEFKIQLFAVEWISFLK